MDKEEMLLLRLDGLSYREIGFQAGITKQRVQQILSPPAAIKQHVYEKYGGRCGRCGLKVGNSGHIHHETTSTGVDDYNDLANLSLLCISCHRISHGAGGYHGLYPADNQKPICPSCGFAPGRRIRYNMTRLKSCTNCGLRFQYPVDRSAI